MSNDKLDAENILREILAAQGVIMPVHNDEFLGATWVRERVEKALLLLSAVAPITPTLGERAVSFHEWWDALNDESFIAPSHAIKGLAWKAWNAALDAHAGVPSATGTLKTHYHKGVSAENCPLCRDAERLSWLNLHWERIEYGGGDLAKLRESIDAAMRATDSGSAKP